MGDFRLVARPMLIRMRTSDSLRCSILTILTVQATFTPLVWTPVCFIRQLDDRMDIGTWQPSICALKSGWLGLAASLAPACRPIPWTARLAFSVAFFPL